MPGLTQEQNDVRFQLGEKANDAAQAEIKRRESLAGHKLTSQEKLTIVAAALNAAGLENHYADPIPGLYEETGAFFKEFFHQIPVVTGERVGQAANGVTAVAAFAGETVGSVASGVTKGLFGALSAKTMIVLGVVAAIAGYVIYRRVK